MRFFLTLNQWAVLKLTHKLERAQKALVQERRKRRWGVTIGRSFSLRYGEARQHIKKLEADLAEARIHSERDFLTDLFNRRGFNRRFAELNSLLDRAGAIETSACILIFDINGMKQMNDSRGHMYMDQILVHFSQILSSVFGRDQDIICREGGDEFVVLLPNTLLPAAQSLAEQVQHDLQMLGIALEAPPCIGISCGIARFQLPSTEEELKRAYAQADRAMYASKSRGGGISLAEDEVKAA